MAQCKWCGHSDESLQVTEDGFCETCSSAITMDITNRLRMIKHCKKLMAESEELDTQLSKSDLIVEHAEALLEYEKRGIPTIQPSPSELIRTYREGRDALILKCAERAVQNALAAAEVLTSTETKISWLSKILPKIQGYRTRADNQGFLDALEKKVINLIHHTRLRAYLEEARDAEVKGHRERALDLYSGALHFLQNDEISESLREENISAIEAKIAELEGAEEAEPEENGA